MFKKALLKTNLTPSQAEILEYLYQTKEAKPAQIAKDIKRSRAIIYKEMEELAKLGLIEIISKPNQTAVIRAGHPSLLTKAMEKRENELKKDKELLNNYLPDMISAYNLQHNKPGIKYYEGEEGARLVTMDSLVAKNMIYTYVDSESTSKVFDDINKEYVKKRLALGIKKLIINTDNQYTRDYFRKNKIFDVDISDITQRKILDGDMINLNTVLQIYNNKISYITVTDKNYMSVIIEDANIAKMHKALFEAHWKNAKTLRQLEGDPVD